MIENNLFQEIPTNFELNGPTLSFTTQPVGIATINGGSATFIGIATATFAQAASNSGSIVYQWYDQNGIISNGTYVTGAATTTLTISNLVSPTDHNRQIYLQADYAPSGVSANALNEPTNSNVGIVTVYPVLSITTQPIETTAVQNVSASFSVVASSTDTTQGTLSYNWIFNGTDLVDSSTVSGSNTPNLTISYSQIGVYSIQVRITNSIASNSPLYSDVVNFYNVPPSKNITIEKYDTTSSTATLSTTDLLVSGDVTLYAQDNTSATSLISLYAKDIDTNVEMEIYAGAGANSGSYTGGQGGVSKIRFTMKKNEEYTIAGLDSTNQCPFVYRKGSLIAVCGKGGDAASSGNGGNGGGINVAGASGGGRGGGSGGSVYSAGTLPSNGIFGSSSSSTPIGSDTKATGQNGGRVIPCPKGNYWISQGKTACADVGTSKIYLANGTLVTNSASITRGFKSGYDVRQTAGQGQAQYSTQEPYTDTCYDTGGSSGYRNEMRRVTFQIGNFDNQGSMSHNEVRAIGPSGYAPQDVSGYFSVSRGINGEDRWYTVKIDKNTDTIGSTIFNSYVERSLGPDPSGKVIYPDRSIVTTAGSGVEYPDGFTVKSLDYNSQSREFTIRFLRSGISTYIRYFIFTVWVEENLWVPYDDTYSNPYSCTQYRTVTVSGSGSGGSGATGGNGGTNSSGGGGGSGYTDGSVNVVSTSQQGGNTGGAKIVIRKV
jgi:hypothetical protein